MIVICILIQVSGILLAILSRIHFSKYKDTENIKQASVLEREEILGQNRVKKMLACSIAILFASASLTEMLVWKGRRSEKNSNPVITRTEYAGDVQTEDIWLTYDDKKYAYTLEVNPMEYTEEEFQKLAQEKVGDIKRNMLGNNTDFSHVTEDLKLPYGDEMGIFAYSWISDNPQIVSSYGTVNTEDVTDTAAVTLTLRVSYLSYMLEEDIPLTVVKEMRRESAVTDTLEALRQLEQETRTKQSVTLPKEYEGVEIALRNDMESKAKRCLVAGVALALLMVPLARLKMRDDGKKRDDTLKKLYPSFVNSLWLLLGSGMTIQMGIRQIISGMEDDVLLKRELEYALHQIENGSEEAWTYEQLGRRLHVPEYYQLMQHLSQHIRMGTKDLRNLMETETQIALKKRREYAKKQGEEASTKLLFPMVVLLATVMLLVVYPAVTGF